MVEIEWERYAGMTLEQRGGGWESGHGKRGRRGAKERGRDKMVKARGVDCTYNKEIKVFASY